ncbi:MAG: hypothetical protein BJ554DRAFT_2787 [Olpidium bornovanus]|uniref:Uncharacterized protein n=1 Tax=Olpidium bornovanus TaxID=278681 RepID=A0A8H7ZQH9_9FUNG|nr:MAG: hypothetical protein BJ554DRAFT_2787 [Olpidium bornovanus]
MFAGVPAERRRHDYGWLGYAQLAQAETKRTLVINLRTYARCIFKPISQSLLKSRRQLCPTTGFPATAIISNTSLKFGFVS